MNALIPSRYMSLRELFEGKTILITGGTGFLGRSLTKEILKYNPHSIRIFSRDEVKHNKLQYLFSGETRIRNFVGDVRDLERLKRAAEGADIVIHAAALKRIDLIEYNTIEAVKTNVMGTVNVVEACLDAGVEKAVFVSTDKACESVNTYGATKFIGERIFTEANFSKGSHETVFTSVRYGNVLESTGSVIPFFVSRIKEGKTIPVTDDRMTRFIITPDQAVSLIFQSLVYGVGGEVFVPKLPAFKIGDLVAVLKEKYAAHNEVEVIGIRPGEKIHELMINESEVPRVYGFENVYVIASMIQKYQKETQGQYERVGKKISEKQMHEYSSKGAVVPRAELKTILQDAKII